MKGICLPRRIRLAGITRQEASTLPHPGISDPPDRIWTFDEAAKRLGIPISTLHRFVRDGTLWATSMKNGGVGLTESEIQRFVNRFEKKGA